MMAKNKTDRYSNIDELMTDLKAVRAGEAPLRAHKRIDVSVLGQLEEGQAVEEKEQVDPQQIIMRYKTAVLALGAVAVILVLVIIMLLLR